MESVLNVVVSCFRDYDTPYDPVNISLLAWLQSEKHREKVERIRSLNTKEERDVIKATLPAITPSGIFSYRAGKNLIQHSGFIQIDIDFKENPHIANYADLKKQLCNLSTVAYCGLSVSGTGYWGLIPIAYPDKHKEHFAAMEKIFASFGIVLDTKPKNVASLRGYSYDPEAYFNHYAKTFTKYLQPVTVAAQPAKFTVSTDSEMYLTEQEITEICIGMICDKGTDLTADYGDWYAIGCNLATTFGNKGLDYYHLISQFYPGYDKDKTEDQFKACQKATTGERASLGVFLDRCKLHNINYTDSDIFKERQAARKEEEKKQETHKRHTDKTDKTPTIKPVLTENTFEELIAAWGFEDAFAQIPYIQYDPETILYKSYEQYAADHNKQLQAS